MKITVGNDGETHQIETEEPAQIYGKQIGEEFDGGIIGLEGYTLKITGGTDRQGFPMRKSIEGAERKKVLLEGGAGIQEDEEGVRRRKSVRGNTVSGEIEQLNTKVVEEGSKSIEDILSEEE
ncbi:MAG: small subunit ribosomal protein S6e [Candidatus Nanohaloarchaea archaeon]|jgi:small subunit ribosomal protein S6e